MLFKQSYMFYVTIRSAERVPKKAELTITREMDGWMVYCIVNGLTITILWVNDDERD